MATQRRRRSHASASQPEKVVAMARIALGTAIEGAAARDPVLADLIARVGPITHRPRDRDGPFGALVRAIVFQQLAGRAAQAIHSRVRTAAGDAITAEALNATSDEALRTAGLSANKLASVRDLSAKVLDGTVVLTRTSRRSDDELIAELTTVRGVGRWTAEMYLMFQLRRLGVWPVDDLGVRQRGYGDSRWNLNPPPKARSDTPRRSANASAPTGRSSPATAGQPSPSSAPARWHRAHPSLGLSITGSGGISRVPAGTPAA